MVDPTPARPIIPATPADGGGDSPDGTTVGVAQSVGEIEITKRASQRDVHLAVRKAGEFIGEMALLQMLGDLRQDGQDGCEPHGHTEAGAALRVQLPTRGQE